MLSYEFLIFFFSLEFLKFLHERDCWSTSASASLLLNFDAGNFQIVIRDYLSVHMTAVFCGAAGFFHQGIQVFIHMDLKIQNWRIAVL